MERPIVIVSHYWRPHRGGIETVAYEQAIRLAKKGFQVSVVTSRLSGDFTERKEGELTIYRVPVFNFLESKGIPYPLFYPSLFWVLWRLISRCEAVLVHSHTFMPSFFAALFGKILRKPVTLLQHNCWIEYPFPWNGLQKIADRTVGWGTFNLATLCLGVSEEACAYGKNVGRRPVQLFYNGIDTKRFAPLEPEEKLRRRKNLGYSPRDFVVLSVRRLTHKNGVDLLLKVAEEFSAKLSVHFIVVGGGAEQARLKRWVESSRMSRVCITGSVSENDLLEYYQIADLFILPSLSGEGFPMAVLEALASALPVVATDTGGHVEVLKKCGAGWVVRPLISELKEGIERAINSTNANEEMKQKARKTAEKMSWDIQVEKLMRGLEHAALVNSPLIDNDRQTIFPKTKNHSTATRCT